MSRTPKEQARARSLATASAPVAAPAVREEDRFKALYPGFWTAIFRSAAEANTDASIDEHIAFMNRFATIFPCATCKAHFHAYLKSMPMERYRTMVDSHGRRIGMSTHAWSFKNAINMRLGKPYFEWRSFEQQWLGTPGGAVGTEIPECTRTCGK